MASPNQYKQSHHRTNRFTKWFVLVAGFSTSILYSGFIFNMPIFYVEWLYEFGKSNSETALVQSIGVGTFYISGCVCGFIVSKFGPRKCGIVGGILAATGLAMTFFGTSIICLYILLFVIGIGLNMSFISTTKCVEIHFEGRMKMIVLSFLLFGSGLGMFIFPLLFEILLEKFDWRGTFLIEAGILLNIVVNSSIYSNPRIGMQIDIDRSSKMEEQDADNVFKVQKLYYCGEMSKMPTEIAMDTTTSYAVHQTTCMNSSIHRNENGNNKNAKNILRRLILDKIFVAYIIILAISLALFNAVMIFFIEYCQSKGISKEDTARMYFYMNITNAVSRLIQGFLKQLPHISVLFLPVLSTLSGCISTTAFTFVGSSNSLNFLVACIFGYGYGSIITSTTITIIKLVRQDDYAVGIGMGMAMAGIFTTLVGPLAGYIRDITGDYDVLLYSVSALFLFCCISFLLIMVYRHYWKET